jgi:hypothetical protein
MLPIVVAGLLLGGCLGSDETPNETSEGAAESAIAKAHRVQVDLEPGWQAAERTLTPDLLNPKELLSVGTLPMKRGSCATVPSRAVEAMRPGDALITIQERAEGRPEDYPPRPKHFRVDPGIGNFECAPQDLKVDSFVFREAGRHFYVLVVVDRGAPIDEAERILNTFEAQPVAN